MQPKYESHKKVRIRVGQESLKVRVKDYGGNEDIKDLRRFNGMVGKIRNQVVGPAIEWAITQWLYDIETEDGSRIHRIPETCLEEPI